MKRALTPCLIFALICYLGIWGIVSLPRAQAQVQVELACPSGSQPIQPVGVTFNPSTGKYRYWLCVDALGNITQIFGSGNAVVTNPSAAQNIILPLNTSGLTITENAGSGNGLTNFSIIDNTATSVFLVSNQSIRFGGGGGFHGNVGAANGDYSGKLACAAGTVTKTFTFAYTSVPMVQVFDETTKGGANLTAISNSAFTVSCTGATDALDYFAIGNPN